MARVSILAVILLAAGCGKPGLRETVERNRHQDGIASRDLDDSRAQLAKLQADRAADRSRLVQMQERLKTQSEVEDLLKKRLANAQREGDRLQADLSTTVAGAAATGAIAPASARGDAEPFQLPSVFVGRLKAFCDHWPGAKYDATTKSVRLPDSTMFEANGNFKRSGWDLLRDFAQTLAPEATDLKLLVQVDVPPGAVPKELEKQHATPWHLATYKAVNIEQALEARGIPNANLGITVQRFDRARQANLAIFFNPPDVTLAK